MNSLPDCEQHPKWREEYAGMLARTSMPLPGLPAPSNSPVVPFIGQGLSPGWTLYDKHEVFERVHGQNLDEGIHPWDAATTLEKALEKQEPQSAVDLVKSPQQHWRRESKDRQRSPAVDERSHKRNRSFNLQDSEVQRSPLPTPTHESQAPPPRSRQGTPVNMDPSKPRSGPRGDSEPPQSTQTIPGGPSLDQLSLVPRGNSQPPRSRKPTPTPRS